MKSGNQRIAWTHVASAAGAVIHLGFVLQVVKVFSTGAIFLMLVVAAPLVLISAAARFLQSRAAHHLWGLSFSGIYVCFGGWAYYDAMYVHPDPQNGLIFIVVPVAGIVATAVATGVGLAITRPARK